MMNGRLCARANASATIGDEVSLRMTLPMDMKKLFAKGKYWLSAFLTCLGARMPVPEVAGRQQHTRRSIQT